MFISTMLKTGLGIALISAAVAHAAAIPEGMPGSPPVLSNAATERFLGGVRDFGTGQPSPSIIYSNAGLAQATNSPEALKGPSITSTGTPAANTPIGSSNLRGGTIERRTNTPYQIPPNQLERRTNTPYPITSPW
jgi:hypothetical protein